MTCMLLICYLWLRCWWIMDKRIWGPLSWAEPQRENKIPNERVGSESRRL